MLREHFAPHYPGKSFGLLVGGGGRHRGPFWAAPFSFGHSAGIVEIHPGLHLSLARGVRSWERAPR
ncbi:MAG TPA: hypothetical protein VF395_15990, partial [Polyangiaceae bacterium]